MKKTTAKSTKKTTKKVAAKKSTSVRHSAPVTRSSKSFWGNDQSMVLLLAAGTIIFLVAGLLFAGWL